MYHTEIHIFSIQNVDLTHSQTDLESHYCFTGCSEPILHRIAFQNGVALNSFINLLTYASFLRICSLLSTLIPLTFH